jgi:pectate lyase
MSLRFSLLISCLAPGGLACSSAPRNLPPAEVEVVPPTYPERPTGWASIEDLGLDGTTGGEGGVVVEVGTTAELRLVRTRP